MFLLQVSTILELKVFKLIITLVIQLRTYKIYFLLKESALTMVLSYFQMIYNPFSGQTGSFINVVVMPHPNKMALLSVNNGMYLLLLMHCASKVISHCHFRVSAFSLAFILSTKYHPPHEALLGVPPSHLHVFGCLCIVYNQSQNKHTFYPRSTPGIFVGYIFG